MLAPKVGELLKDCEWVGVPFAGGMSELAHIKARTLAVNDLHRHVINLASVVASHDWGPKLYRYLRRVPFHPDVLADVQERCIQAEKDWDRSPWSEHAQFNWALAYFICAWMSRNGTAGTDKEFQASMSLRWEAGGGDSAVRFRNAAESLKDWRKVLARATFTTLDAFDFLTKCKDRKGHGIYCDPPFPGPGDGYKHKFTEEQHARLSLTLSGFGETRIVCRFYDHPLVRDLYPAATWRWNLLTGRKQTNAEAPEVLLVRN